MADVSIDIELVTKAFNAALKESGDKVKGFQVQVKRGEKGITTSFKKIDAEAKKTSQGFNVLKGSIASFVGNLAAGAVAGFTRTLVSLASGLKQVAIEATNAAIDAEETRSKFQTVFQDISAEANKTATNLSTAFGLGAVEAQKLLSSTGDLLSGFGFTQESALDLSNQVQELAVDLASFSNFSGGAEGASEALTKALLGERESVKALGISIQEKDVQEQVAINRAKGLIFETERQAKAQATLDIAIKQSQNAIGDYAKTSGSAANQSKLFDTIINDLKENVGQAFVPVVQTALVEVNKFLQAFDVERIKTFLTDGLKAFASVTISTFNVVLASVDAAIITFDALKLGVSVIATVALTSAEGLAKLGQVLLEITGQDPSETLDSIANTITELRKTSQETTESISNDIQNRIADRKKEGLALQAFAEKIREAGNTEVEVIKQTNDRKNQIAQEQLAKELEAERIKQATLAEVRAEFESQKEIVEVEAQIASAEQEGLDLETIRNFEQEKINIIRDAELEKAELIQDGNDQLRAQEAAKQKAEVATLKADLKLKRDLRAQDKKNKEQEVKFEKQLLTSRLNAASGFLSAGLTLAKEGSTQQKVLQTGLAVISTYSAANQALSSPPGPPFTIPLVAATIAQGLANVAKINSVGSFQQGGIIPGNSFSGDNLQANVNSGEVILNRNQAANTLFKLANEPSSDSGGSTQLIGAIRQLGDRISSMELVLVADDNEIARSASRGVDNGIVIGAS